jgi:hypothetical protein
MLVEVAWHYYEQSPGVSAVIATHQDQLPKAVTDIADRYDIRTVQELLGHADVATPMICSHVLNIGGGGVRSPLDAILLV